MTKKKLTISRLVTRKDNFSFNQVMNKNIEKLLRNLDTKKASQDTGISTRNIKENPDLLAHFILKNYNDMLLKREFSQTLKNANVTPVYKKDS